LRSFSRQHEKTEQSPMTTDHPSTLHVLYFAWVRERIGVAREEVTTTARTPRDLMIELAARDDRYAAAFADTGALRVAIDQTLADHDAPLAGAQEVAIFPPMTGG
jgi:molybdopterin synthase sulfur carrier subunit